MPGLFEGTEFYVPPRCDRCDELESDCRCAPLPEPLTPPEKQTAQVAVEKRKRGKTMTVVCGLANEQQQLSQLLTELKNKCGGGGTVRDGNIEIQGSHADRIQDALRAMGYRVRP